MQKWVRSKLYAEISDIKSCFPMSHLRLRILRLGKLRQFYFNEEETEAHTGLKEKFSASGASAFQVEKGANPVTPRMRRNETVRSLQAGFLGPVEEEDNVDRDRRTPLVR